MEIRARGGHAHRLFCVRCHLLRIEIQWASFRLHELVLPAANLATPLAPLLIEHRAGFLGIEWQRASVPTVFDRQRIERA